MAPHAPAAGDAAAPERDAAEFSLIEYRHLLFRASHAQRALLHPFMAAIGLGTGQPKFLSYLNQNGPCSQRELAQYYELDPAGVSRALDALERKGFVTFAPKADDRRAKVVILTEEGKRVAQAWDAACREEASAMLRDFSQAERASFADYLVRAHANLRAYSREIAGDAGDAFPSSEPERSRPVTGGGPVRAPADSAAAAPERPAPAPANSRDASRTAPVDPHATKEDAHA